MWQGYYGPGNHHTVAFVKPNDPNETYREDHYTDKGVLDHKEQFRCYRNTAHSRSQRSSSES